MMTASDVKRVGCEHGADLVGIATMDRFEGAPPQWDPRKIFPGARAMVVCACRIPRGSLVGIEEGTFFQSYSMMGYAGINFVRMPMVLWGLTAYLEDAGYDALPIANEFPWQGEVMDTGAARKEWSRPVAPGKPAPDVNIHFRIAAFAAGLGEIGYSKVFLTPEFGPRQRFGAVLTNAPLAADPLFDGQICDRCMLCAKHCSGHAISTEETVRVTVAGREIEWGRLDERRCRIAFHGGNPETNPFYPDQPPQKIMWHGEAWEGACGCIRECMIHLEKKGVLKNRFKEPFRRRPPWRLPPDWKKNLPLTAPRLEGDEIRWPS
jgi:Pyruvate/2-oxoacid:ferredoxin oxidoreductase delta subunit